ncbi:MAG TPA: glycine oxidase ThiO [Ktedonobacteraceae bacterium]|jgi:glycine oxidase
MEHKTDVLIVGAGIMGSAIAYNLRKRGVDVLVLDREETGSQASSAAAGLLAPLGPLSGPGPFADLLLTSFSLFPSLVPELETTSGLQLGYEQTGALRTVRNPKRVSNLKKRLEAWKPLGLTMHWLTGDEARQREPLLAADVSAAIYAPEESQIQAPQITQAFSIAAEKRGARFYTHAEVLGVKSKGEEITGVETSQEEIINCSHLVLATGSWAAQHENWFNISLPVRPVKGQIIAVQETTTPLKHIIFGEATYIARKQERIIVGATKEEAGFNTQITDEGVSWLRDTAIRFIPAMQQSPLISSWAGLRPGTPDKQPILGPAPRWKNVTLALGHNSVGIILSAITGQTIAELVATGSIPEIIRPFSLERF